MTDEKFQPPDPVGLLSRYRLVEAAGHEDRSLTVITAAAGFGKSVLMAQLHHDSQGTKLWYRLDESDADDARFIGRLAGIMRSSLPGFGSGEAFEDVTAGRHRLHTGFVNSLFETNRPILLFLDDFHTISGSAGMMELFQVMFGNLPENVRIVLAGRQAPALPLGRLRILRKINEIDGAALRFTLEETALMLDDSARPYTGTTGTLYARTGGWPWAVAALGAAMGESGGREAEDIIDGVKAEAFRFIHDEVIEGIDADLDWFLTRSSVVREISGGACDEVLYRGRQGEAARMLNLADEKCLLVPDDALDGTFRLQGWFREFFQDRLDTVASDGEVNRLHLGFARVASASGRYASAMRHYLAAGRPELAALQLEERAGAMLAAGRASVAQSWLARLPEENIKARPALRLLRARIALLKGDLLTAKRCLKAASDGDDNSGDIASECELAASDLAWLSGDLAGSIDSASKALKLAAGRREGCIAALYRMAVRRSMRGESEEAGRLLAEAAGVARGDAPARNQVSLAIAAISLLEGRFTDVLAETSRIAAGRSGGLIDSCQAGSLEAEALFLTGEYEAAANAAGKALTLAQRCGDALLKWRLEALLGKALFSLGEKGKGEARLNEAGGHLRGLGVISPAGLIGIGEAHHQAGRLKAAIAAHEKALAFSRQGGITYYEAASLIQIGAAKAGQKSAGGETELTEAAAIARRAGFNYLYAQALFHQAALALRLRRRSDALADLRTALSLASANRYDHFLIREGKGGSGCLPLAVSEDIETEYLLAVGRRGGPELASVLLPLLKSSSASVRERALLAVSACGGSTALRRISKLLDHPDESTAALAASELRKHRQSDLNTSDLLTGRELQVLSLLADGLSNADIASRLFLSEGTVKNHVGRIFRKLGISRRVQAARYYHEKGAEGALQSASRLNP